MAVIDATFADLTAEGADADAAKSSCAERITRTREFFGKVVEQDGVKVLIDSKALFSIIGSEMDWHEDRLR